MAITTEETFNQSKHERKGEDNNINKPQSNVAEHFVEPELQSYPLDLMLIRFLDKGTKYIYIIVFVITAILFGLIYSQPNITSIDLMKSKYKTQGNYFWEALESGVSDVIELERPSTFMLLYEPHSEKTIIALLRDISGYITHQLADEHSDPVKEVILTEEILTSNRVIEDHGTLIGDYKEQLEKSHLMIVKNLEKVQGSVAQAFHFFCDEYSPLVNKAVIIFTVKVEQFPSEHDHYNYLEKLFKRKWNTLEEDIFEPLFVRITSMVLNVKDENLNGFSLSKLDLNKELVFSPFAWLACLLLMVSMIFTLLGYYFYIVFYHGDIITLVQEYPALDVSIWNNLFKKKVAYQDNFFIFSKDNCCIDNIIQFIQNNLGINMLNLTRDDLKNIDKFYKQNVELLKQGCILLVEDVDKKVIEQLYRLYRENNKIKSLLRKQTKMVFVYTIKDSKLCEQPLTDILNENLLGKIPGQIKIFKPFTY